MSYACAGLLNSMETFFKVLAAIVGVLSAKSAAFLIRAYTLVRPSSPRLSIRQRDANRYYGRRPSCWRSEQLINDHRGGSNGPEDAVIPQTLDGSAYRLAERIPTQIAVAAL